jgi:hypothetical protein
MTTVPVCSNPFNKQKHIKINGLRKPSKKILRNYPSLSAEQLLCNSCRKELSSSKVQFDVYLQAPSTSTVTLEEISPSPVDRKVSVVCGTPGLVGVRRLGAGRCSIRRLLLYLVINKF